MAAELVWKPASRSRFAIGGVRGIALADQVVLADRAVHREGVLCDVGGLWVPDGAEFVEGIQFRGHEELDARIAHAYQEFVASGRYVVRLADDVTPHDDIVTFTIQLTTPDGEVAWAARVFVILGADGLIREDYQFTVKPLAA